MCIQQNVRWQKIKKWYIKNCLADFAKTWYADAVADPGGNTPSPPPRWWPGNIITRQWNNKLKFSFILRQLWAGELVIHHFWSHFYYYVNYINTVKTAFKWRTNQEILHHFGTQKDAKLCLECPKIVWRPGPGPTRGTFSQGLKNAFLCPDGRVATGKGRLALWGRTKFEFVIGSSVSFLWEMMWLSVSVSCIRYSKRCKYRPKSQSVNQSINPSINQAVNQISSLFQSVNQTIIQSINQSINQSNQKQSVISLRLRRLMHIWIQP